MDTENITFAGILLLLVTGLGWGARQIFAWIKNDVWPEARSGFHRFLGSVEDTHAGIKECNERNTDAISSLAVTHAGISAAWKAHCEFLRTAVRVMAKESDQSDLLSHIDKIEQGLTR